MSSTEPLAVDRPGFVPSAFLLALFVIPQLMLLQSLPALAANPCSASMAPIPGGSYRIGAGT